ncbi:MAG: hypothetical protein EBT89_04555 [Opitutaceae bacterium]|nr:hypothetical protein [Opitutaceae bacterium]NBX59256.1 hypothetical protein [Opitutaceae bacterium]
MVRLIIATDGPLWLAWIFLFIGLTPIHATEAALAKAQIFYDSGRYAEAHSILAEHDDSRAASPAALYLLGKIKVHCGDYTAAIQLLARAVALAPLESDYQLWLGNSYAWAASTADLKDKAQWGRKSLRAYQAAIELKPDNLSAHLSLLNFYRHVPRVLGGGLARAYREADEIRRHDPVQGAYALAILYLQEKRFTQAAGALATVLANNPRHYGANVALGRLALATGVGLKQGESAFRLCLTLEPSENDCSHEQVAAELDKLVEQFPQVAAEI